MDFDLIVPDFTLTTDITPLLLAIFILFILVLGLHEEFSKLKEENQYLERKLDKIVEMLEEEASLKEASLKESKSDTSDIDLLGLEIFVEGTENTDLEKKGIEESL